MKTRKARKSKVADWRFFAVLVGVALVFSAAYFIARYGCSPHRPRSLRTMTPRRHTL
jgi:hypothetical protein